MRGKQRIWLVVRNTLLSRQFESMSSKERCTRSHGIYGYYFVLTLNLYLFLNSKPSAISRSPFLAKKSPKLLCQILKNRSAYRWRNTVIVSVAAHIEIYIVLAGEQSVTALGIKTVRGLLHNIGMSFVQERVHPGRHMVAGSNYSKRVIRRSDMSENACRTFQGSKSVIWYLLRCLKL